ncbi:MAG TPA: S8/S53 family peptidase [Streptosporangiaceae bacterium]|nr:S8/S53 family peptidase [Streptosporangiaceae bacterium]
MRHQILRLLQERRRGTDVTQFDYLPADEGFDPLVVRGELLITRDSAERDRSRLDALGLRAERQDCAERGCEELHKQVLRLTHQEGPDHMGPGQRADLAKTLRSRGTSAALTAAGTNAAVVKSTGGPRPVQARALSTSPGGGPRVAIIDTGISEQRRDTVSSQSQPDDLHEFPLGNSAAEVEEREKYLSLDAGHGTFVTGIVQQLAPHADITVYRALDSDGIGSEVRIACAMIRAVKDGNQIINLSLGCQTQDDYPPLAIHRALELIWEWEREHGQEVLVVAAAGNYGDTRPCWPAAFRSVVSVAALTSDMTPARWSSRGFWVMCSTIGQGISSTFVEGTESPFYASPSSAPPVPLAEFHGKPPWAAWNGTSFVAPQIVGKLVQLCQTSGQSPRTALRDLLAEGSPLPEFGRAIEILPGI